MVFMGGAGRAEESDRHRWLSPAEVLDVLQARPGMTVAEVGAASGRLTSAIAEGVGDTGQVFAIESSPEVVSRLRQFFDDHRNVHVVDSVHEKTTLPEHSCDRVLIVNLWTELPDPMAVLREASRVLRHDGRLLIVEWHAGAEAPDAPPPEKRMSFEEMLCALEKNCWDVHRHGDAGPHSYFIEAGVSDESVQS